MGNSFLGPRKCRFMLCLKLMVVSPRKDVCDSRSFKQDEQRSKPQMMVRHNRHYHSDVFSTAKALA